MTKRNGHTVRQPHPKSAKRIVHERKFVSGEHLMNFMEDIWARASNKNNPYQREWGNLYARLHRVIGEKAEGDQQGLRLHPNWFEDALKENELPPTVIAGATELFDEALRKHMNDADRAAWQEAVGKPGHVQHGLSMKKPPEFSRD